MTPVLIQLALYGGFIGAGYLIRHLAQPKVPAVPVPPVVPTQPASGPVLSLLQPLLAQMEANLQAQLQQWLKQQALQVLGTGPTPATAAPKPTN